MADADHGVEVMGRVGEVMPDEAQGRIAEIYEDVRCTLRVPFVNYVFRATANFPEVFDGLWQELRGVARRAEFERTADSLREQAAAGDLADEVGSPAVEDAVDEDGQRRAEAFNETIHYVLPKLLLVASGFALILDDDVPDGSPPDLGAALPYGPADGSQALAMVGPDEAGDRVTELYEDIQDRHGHPGVASYYRALAQWPRLLEAVWDAVRPVVGDASYRRLTAELTVTAQDAARELLVGCRTRRQLGLPTDESRDVRDLVEVFRVRLVPDLLVDVTLIRPLLGTRGPNRLRAAAPADTRSDG